MVSGIAEQPQLFTQLSNSLKRKSYGKAIEICNKIRATNPDDMDAVATKCICLIHEQEYRKAIDTTAKYSDLAFEKAYCHYKLNDMPTALKTLQSILEPRPVRVLILEAQVFQRLGEFGKCISIYEALLSKETEDPTELRTNMLAACAAAGQSRIEIQKFTDDEGSYEVAYNKACTMISAGKLSEADAELESSEALCKEMLEAENCPTEELDQELAIIRVQRAYVMQLTGNSDAAMSTYRSVLKAKDIAKHIQAVASNNIVVLRGSKDLFDSLKRLKSIYQQDMEKLMPTQMQAILQNRALLLCHMNKGIECREVLKTLGDLAPESDACILIQAALFLNEKDVNGCRKMLTTGMRSTVPIVQLTLAHTLLIEGQVEKAIEIIESIDALKHLPGTVATLVCMYESIGRIDRSLEVLERAEKYHDANDPTSVPALQLREAGAAYKLSKGMYQEAAEAYQVFVNGSVALDTDRRLRCLASLVIALSHYDVDAAERHSTMLPPLPEISVDVEDLERFAPRSVRPKASQVIDSTGENEKKRSAVNKRKLSRKRAKRREKFLEMVRQRDNYTANIPLPKPDPERWIPRNQRSYAKRGRKGRNKFVGAQGSGMGAQKDAAKLDTAARVAAKNWDAQKEQPKSTVATGKSSAAQRKSQKKKRR